MAKEVDINVSGLLDDLQKWGVDAGAAVRETVQDIMDDWKRESVDLAPVDTTTLRRSIHYRTQKRGTTGVDVTGEIKASAIETGASGGRFDYAYWIHEVKGDSFKGRTSGTIGRFLDVPAEENEKKWLLKIEEDLKAKARARGF
ncbi:HK97 gp10 family phage protein [Paenibacillus sp. 1P03SA]|uniref:HK97 gp10 family phage protein n=1 Tax=Paenibacillus sp. 1P03SA TaxID=3132294 RepID=UPI0039A3072C